MTLADCYRNSGASLSSLSEGWQLSGDLITFRDGSSLTFSELRQTYSPAPPAYTHLIIASTIMMAGTFLIAAFLL